MSTDITQWLLEKAPKIPTEKVIKSEQFNLFHGTHALEIGNVKLDTGLIKLSDEEANFDCSAKRSLKEVLWISDSVFRSIFTWLNNSALSVTVLSNRYVEELLLRYAEDKNIEACKFYNKQAKDLLIDRVLRSVILGCLSFVKLVVTLSQGGVVYEEEDINSSSMNLDIITMIDSSDIAKEIEFSIDFLTETYKSQKDAEILIKILTVLLNFLDLPYFFSVPLPEHGTSLPFDIEILNSLSNVVESLASHLEYLDELPAIPGCYSMGIQKRLDNRAPTRELISYKEENYSSLVLFVKDSLHMFEVYQRKSPLDVINYAKNFSNTRHHVLSRAIFPMFLIRDDGSIFGSESIKNFVVSELIAFNSYGSPYLSTENAIVQKKLDDFLNKLSMNYLDYFQTMNQNPCRQRQHLLKNILIFDSLQVASESLELELIDVFKLKDTAKENGQDIPALPLTSWIYYKKLIMMVEIMFKGFELELYDTWEFQGMYWLILNFLSHLIEILERIQKYIITKMQLFKSQGTHLAKLRESLSLITHELTHYKTLNSLTLLQTLNLQQLHAQDIQKLPTFPFSSLERLFELRLKPFKSIGVPQQPTFSDFEQFLETKPLTPEEFKAHTDKLKTEINNNLNTIIKAPCYQTIGKKDWDTWFNQYKRSLIGITLNLYKCGVHDKKTYRVQVVREGFHRYFPVVKCVKK